MRLPEECVATLMDFVPEEDLRTMRVVTGWPGRWLPAVLGMSAVTFAPFVFFRTGSYNPVGVRGRALVAHEAHHFGQAREMGRVLFYVKYVQGQFQCGFRHRRHPMEIPAIELQRAVSKALRPWD